MTQIKVSSQPTQSEIAADPRSFAIFRQLCPGTSDSLTLEDLQKASKTYGEGKPVNLSGTVSYKEVAALLHRKPTQLEGQSGNAIAWAAQDKSGHLTPFHFDRPAVGAHDIRIQILHCGVCHSDLHQIKDEWDGSTFPMVPGHEIVGVVTEVGAEVKSFKVGEHAGIGCYIRACGECQLCEKTVSHYCKKCVLTYNSKDWAHGDAATQGGYSNFYVVSEKYACHVPDNLPLAAAAPLLCAGITVWSPMQHFGLNQKGMKLGVVGLGGLGHMAVKLGKALGLEVTVISTSPKKEKEAREVLGADHFVVSKDEKAMLAAAGSLDGIIDTVSASHDLSAEIALLGVEGKLILVGVPPDPYAVSAGQLIFARKLVAGSMIGSIKETQEMLDFCGKNNILCEVERIPIDYINTAMERLVKNDVHYRFSIDIAATLV